MASTKSLPANGWNREAEFAGEAARGLFPLRRR
jgi:hypothetical protein